MGKNQSGISLSCVYEEDIETSMEKRRWYESEVGTVLFHLTRDALSSEQFRAKYEDNDDGKGKIVTRWGRSTEVEQMRNSFKMIPVSIMNGGVKNAVPREVFLELQYYQLDSFDKRLVEAKLYFGDLCTIFKHPEKLREMFDQGILPCELDINGDLKSFEYALKFSLYPLDWFQLLNKFQFDGHIYVGIFTLAGIAGAFLGFILCFLNRLLTNLRFPPQFHGE